MEKQDAKGKNATSCFCRVCGCKVFLSAAATFVEQEVNGFCVIMNKSNCFKYSLPTRKGAACVAETCFWSCSMMDFENIGFTHTKDNIKFLTCADCEQEVLGFQDLSNPKVMFVAVERLLYDADKAAELKQRSGAPSIESLLGNLSPEQLEQLSKNSMQ